MRVSDLPWMPHPLIPELEKARFFGHSILRDAEEVVLVTLYEVMDKEGDTYLFATDEELLAFLKERLPGCFISEGE